jgi:hypothetical protein
MHRSKNMEAIEIYDKHPLHQDAREYIYAHGSTQNGGIRNRVKQAEPQNHGEMNRLNEFKVVSEYSRRATCRRRLERLAEGVCAGIRRRRCWA